MHYVTAVSKNQSAVTKSIKMWSYLIQNSVSPSLIVADALCHGSFKKSIGGFEITLMWSYHIQNSLSPTLIVADALCHSSFKKSIGGFEIT